MRTIKCAWCGALSEKKTFLVNRANRTGAPLYCDAACAGLGRRNNKSDEQRRAEKAAYDSRRLESLREKINAKKRERYRATYDPEKAAAYRATRMHLHVEYCRRPEYKAWKSEYDKLHRAKMEAGEYWEAWLAARAIQQEVLAQSTRYEINLAAGKLNKSTRRKRDHAAAHR